jgi:uroporphyrinogen-III decarboxylase
MRELMGDENACLAFIEEPHLVEELLGALGELCERAFSQLPADAIPDELFIHEDFAGKSGPIIGPETFRRFVTPYYKRISECWVSRGVAIFDVDSDGFIEPVLDAMIEAGVNCVHPLEPAAGTDMVRLRKRYGRRLVLRGGIDKFSLMRGRDAIRAELEYKMQPIMRGGGVMFGLDHRIPNGTPLEAYRFYVETGRAILGLPPIDSSSRGWARMA